MSLPSRCSPSRILSRIPQATSRLPPRTRPNLAVRFKSTDTNSIPPPKRLRELRAKEHLVRKSLLAGIIAATGVAYYLDGKYNARAVRRTLRTAWVGATLGADYKWNFTYPLALLTCLTLVPKKLSQLKNYINESQDG